MLSIILTMSHSIIQLKDIRRTCSIFVNLIINFSKEVNGKVIHTQSQFILNLNIVDTITISSKKFKGFGKLIGIFNQSNNTINTPNILAFIFGNSSIKVKHDFSVTIVKTLVVFHTIFASIRSKVLFPALNITNTELINVVVDINRILIILKEIQLGHFNLIIRNNFLLSTINIYSQSISSFIIHKCHMEPSSSKCFKFLLSQNLIMKFTRIYKCTHTIIGRIQTKSKLE